MVCPPPLCLMKISPRAPALSYFSENSMCVVGVKRCKHPLASPCDMSHRKDVVVFQNIQPAQSLSSGQEIHEFADPKEKYMSSIFLECPRTAQTAKAVGLTIGCAECKKSTC